ncbi:hypothetical protein MMUR_28990 [Mycolicibacterium murale]|uniref:Uncharacterized protein n=1 Tax=Mycolicibacterium murale TaxID=182220 RepID=A0A7I9WM83_9MYCO|nr:hypothetical protein [Mycolicibacterium murale]MCV7185936.1 hypothetical protein [Mycolicibacterium murale]GFG58763.1 hypothetical protein MMUR_28990 [Mycolicibacterium murale]
MRNGTTPEVGASGTESDNRLDLDWAAEVQYGDAYRRSCVLAGVAENLHDELRSGVGDEMLLANAFRNSSPAFCLRVDRDFSSHHAS